MNNQTKDKPLGMVVHTLGSANAFESVADDVTSDKLSKSKPSGQGKLLTIMLLCSLPVALSYIGYHLAKRPSTTEFGDFVLPVLAVPNHVAIDLEGKPRSLPSLKGQWLMVSIDSGACNDTCKNRLFLHRQLRETLGKGKDRVDWVWLLNDEQIIDPNMRKPLADAVVLRADARTLQSWFPQPGANQTVSDFVYVVDPLGNTVLRFPASFNASNAATIRRVLERLLRGTASWDKPGRK